MVASSMTCAAVGSADGASPSGRRAWPRWFWPVSTLLLPWVNIGLFALLGVVVGDRLQIAGNGGWWAAGALVLAISVAEVMGLRQWCLHTGARDPRWRVLAVAALISLLTAFFAAVTFATVVYIACHNGGCFD